MRAPPPHSPLEEETRSAKQLTMAEETHSPLKEVSITETLLGVPPSSFTNLQSNHNHIIKDTAAEELHSITTQLRRIGSKTELSNTSLIQQELEIDVPIFLSIPDFSLDKQSNDARAQINDHRSNQIHHESNTSSSSSSSSYMYGNSVRPILSRERNALKQAALALPPLPQTSSTTATAPTAPTAPNPPTTPNAPKVYDRRPSTITVRFTTPFDEDYIEPELLGYEVHLARTRQDLELGNGTRRALVLKGKPPPTIITDLVSHASYSVRVRTQWCGGWSDWSTATKVAMFRPSAPMKPNVIVVPQSNSISVNVNVPSDGRADGLIVNRHEIIVWSNQRTRYPKGKFELKKVVAYNAIDQIKLGADTCRKCNQVISNGILTRTKYNIEVRCRNEAGWSKTYVESVTTPTSDGPPPPQNLQLLAQHPNSATFVWEACLGIASLPLSMFELQLHTGDGISVVKRERTSITTIDTRTNETNHINPYAMKAYKGTMTQLPPNQRLMVSVKVKNTKHWSNPSCLIPLLSKAPRFPGWLNDPKHPPLRVVDKTKNDQKEHDGQSDPHITLQWHSPDDDGGVPLIGQEIRVKETWATTTQKHHKNNHKKHQDNEILFPLKPMTRGIVLRGMWPDTQWSVSLRGRNRRGWGKWSSPTLLYTQPLPMPHEEGAIVEAWWNGPWMHKEGFYTATVKRHRARRRKRTNQLGEPGLYTLVSVDYPDSEFQCYDHQVRALGSFKGTLGHLKEQEKPSDDVVYQEYCDFFQTNPLKEHNVHDSSSDEYHSSCSDDDEDDYLDDLHLLPEYLGGGGGSGGHLKFQRNQLLSSLHFGGGGGGGGNSKSNNLNPMPIDLQSPTILEQRIVTKRDVIRALTPPTESFLSSFHKVGDDKRSRIRGKRRQTGDSIWWKSSSKKQGDRR